MPIVDLAGQRVTKNDAVSDLEFSDLHLDFFKVRFAVRPSINACDFHECVLHGNFTYVKSVFMVTPVGVKLFRRITRTNGQGKPYWIYSLEK